MQHIDELSLMMYVDDELIAEEREQVKLHLSGCTKCQQVYAQLLDEKCWLVRCFSDVTQPKSDIRLNPFTQVQIEAIASLHQRRSQFGPGRLSWLAAIAAVMVIAFVFAQSYAFDWVSSLWSVWQSNLLWQSAFWLRENADDLLLHPLANMLEISLILLALIGLLVFLNFRSTSARYWNGSQGGAEK